MEKLKEFKVNDILEVTIEALIYGGDGLARTDGMAIFIANAVRGDELKIKLDSVKKNYAHASIVEIIKPAENRVNPPCNYANDCGGCQWQQISYEEQLEAKRTIVIECFEKIARLKPLVKKLIANDCLEEYRAKVQFPVQMDEKQGHIQIGYYKKKSHDVVDIHRCLIQPNIIDEITNYLRESLTEKRLKAYDSKTKKGLIRHIVFRYSQSRKELMVVFVVFSKRYPKELKAVAKELKRQYPSVTGVIVNFNERKSDVVFGEKHLILEGQDYIVEELNGIQFRISALSFFQVNTSVAVKIFDEVFRFIKNQTQNPRILDVFAGVGAFSLWLTTLAKEIVTVEENPHAIKDQNRNIEQANQQDKIKWFKGNAERVLHHLLDNAQVFDVIILDPPRKGCSQKILDAVVKLSSGFCIYVSCNPSTLARDVLFLTKNGFDLEWVQPFDMFSYTYHIECIAFLKKED